MLTKVRGAMHAQQENYNTENISKIPNRIHRAEEYNNQLEKSKRAVQQQPSQTEERISKLKEVSGIQPIRIAKRKKTEKK